MNRPRPSPADIAWLILAAEIAIFDYWAAYDKKKNRDTMSQSFDRAMNDPVKRWPTALAWAYITAHLFNRRRNAGRYTH